jgi:hypothetical protein
MIPLPRFTFLNGPKGSGKTTLCALLQGQDFELCPVAFVEPIRNALLAIFYPDELYTPGGMDLRDQKVKFLSLPIPNAAGKAVPIRNWMLWFGAQMRSAHGDDVFGRLAMRTCDLNAAYYPRFILDGARIEGDIHPFYHLYPDDCLLIQLHRPGCDWTGDLGSYLSSPHSINLPNVGKPTDMLTELASLVQPQLQEEML